MHTRTFLICLAAAGTVFAQAPDGRSSFQNRCSACHGTDGNGGEHGPSILARLQGRSEQDLTAFLREGVPLRGMPAFNNVPAPEMSALVSFLPSIVPPQR